jgi:hypothetical protein
MFESVNEFTFEEDSHSYKSEGRTGHAVTTLLKNHRLISYDNVREDWLEIARNRGKTLHAWTANRDRTGDGDFLSLPEEWCGYAEAYELFLRQSGMEILDIEKSLMASIYGVLIGGTPDRRCRWKRTREVTPDYKFCSAPMSGWSIQVAFYEVMKKRKVEVGNTDRCTIRFMPDGRYDITWYDDKSDADIVSSILTLEAWRMNHGLSNGKIKV